MASVSVTALGSADFSGSFFFESHSALTACASRMQAFSVGAVIGTLFPFSRSWMNQLPDGSFLAFGILMLFTPISKRTAPQILTRLIFTENYAILTLPVFAPSRKREGGETCGRDTKFLCGCRSECNWHLHKQVA
ncbi:hypothetical protein NE612_01405 [Oscillibacter valericigenes]|nr:hypothetical protein [Oscillibacter valericigenes]